MQWQCNTPTHPPTHHQVIHSQCPGPCSRRQRQQVGLLTGAECSGGAAAAGGELQGTQQRQIVHAVHKGLGVEDDDEPAVEETWTGWRVGETEGEEMSAVD